MDLARCEWPQSEAYKIRGSRPHSANDPFLWLGAIALTRDGVQNAQGSQAIARTRDSQQGPLRFFALRAVTLPFVALKRARTGARR